MPKSRDATSQDNPKGRVLVVDRVSTKTAMETISMTPESPFSRYPLGEYSDRRQSTYHLLRHDVGEAPAS